MSPGWAPATVAIVPLAGARSLVLPSPVCADLRLSSALATLAWAEAMSAACVAGLTVGVAGVVVVVAAFGLAAAAVVAAALAPVDPAADAAVPLGSASTWASLAFAASRFAWACWTATFAACGSSSASSWPW